MFISKEMVIGTVKMKLVNGASLGIALVKIWMKNFKVILSAALSEIY